MWPRRLCIWSGDLVHAQDYMYVACWKYAGEGAKPILLKEPLKYEAIHVQTRNYKS